MRTIETVDTRISEARVFVEIGDLREAEAVVAGMLEERPDDLAGLELLAKIKHMKGELTEAIAVWAQVHARSAQNETGFMRLKSLLKIARDSDKQGGDFLVLGPFQLWRKPAAHLELDEVFRLFLGRRPDEARERCEHLAHKYRGKDTDLFKLAVLAQAWIAELSGDLDIAKSILEDLGNERGFESDPDRLLALARIYEGLGSAELLHKAISIYQHFDRDLESLSVLGRLASLSRAVGEQEEAAEYDKRFLDLFRRRMHRPSRGEVIQVAARRYVPLDELRRLQLTAEDGEAMPTGRERTIALALEGDFLGARKASMAQEETIDIKYRADLAFLDGSLEEAIRLYVDSLRSDPNDLRVLGRLLRQQPGAGSTRIAAHFAQPEVASTTFEALDAAVRASPHDPALWEQMSGLHRILGRLEEANRCSERASALRRASLRSNNPVGRVLSAAVYHFVGKARGLIHEVWAGRRPVETGRGGFLEEILGNITPEMIQAVRNTFVSVREYARTKWPQQTQDILDYNYSFKVTKEDEPSGGLSGGLPAALAFLSVFLDRSVPQDMALSGVLVADAHDVLVVRPVGEPEYKVRGAYNRNLRALVLPRGNQRELESSPLVPASVCREIVLYVSDLDDVVVLTFGSDVWIQ